MLMSSQQDVGSNADVVAAGCWPVMLMSSQQGVGHTAGVVTAGCWPEC